MKTFKSEDTFNVAGRGLIKTVNIPNPKRVMYQEGIPEINEVVKIDDECYRVHGVEMFTKLVSPPFTGEGVGLVVIPVSV